MVRLCVLLIAAYQRLVSPLLGARCRYRPPCSAYAAQAITQHGVALGVRLACLRVRHCRPGYGCGWDPVPRNVHRTTPAAAPGRAGVTQQ